MTRTTTLKKLSETSFKFPFQQKKKKTEYSEIEKTKKIADICWAELECNSFIWKKDCKIVFIYLVGYTKHNSDANHIFKSNLQCFLFKFRLALFLYWLEFSNFSDHHCEWFRMFIFNFHSPLSSPLFKHKTVHNLNVIKRETTECLNIRKT
jgi:hypothetical protein